MQVLTPEIRGIVQHFSQPGNTSTWCFTIKASGKVKFKKSIKILNIKVIIREKKNNFLITAAIKQVPM